jgi:Asp/Glu/hydantoin racemase
MPPRIVLIHAVSVAMEPVARAFEHHWPDADLVNLLEDSLSRDRAAEQHLSPAMAARFDALTRYSLKIGAKGILFTCSAFGEAIETARAGVKVPVLKPNEAMFEQALSAGGRIGMLATFQPSVESMEEEFEQAARAVGSDARLQTVCVVDAMAALKAGDVAAHNALLANAASALGSCDAVMLAHFSTSRARDAVSEVLDCPVLTSPGSAVAKLKAALDETA